MTDYNLESYSDKVWQGGRKFGREQAIDDVLEIIDKAQTYKMAVGSTDLFIDREAFRDEVLALKGGEQ